MVFYLIFDELNFMLWFDNFDNFGNSELEIEKVKLFT